MRRVVVFPAPLEPMKPKRSPRLTVRLSALRAIIEPYRRVRANVCTAGTPLLRGGGTGVMVECSSSKLGRLADRNGQSQHRVAVTADGFELVERASGRRVVGVPRQQDGV